uniref:Uncharacterized protein n=1 Tax=Anguilla anguilla TaxID=7936 RepID=A0A0E9XBV1_ANGAN
MPAQNRFESFSQDTNDTGRKRKQC